MSKQKRDNYLQRKNGTTFVDDARWPEFMKTHYNFDQFRSVSEQNDKIDGAITLTLANHTIFGKYLVTAPFANYGGFYFENQQSLNCLVQYSEKICAEHDANYVVLRHIYGHADLPSGWKKNDIYATYIIDLENDPDEIFHNSIKKRARRDVNKALRESFQIKFGTYNLVDDFWNTITRSMQELGSPYHSKKYLTDLFDIWGMDAQIGVAYTQEGEPFGCCLLMFHKETAVLLHANILQKFRAMCSGDFLYWSVISECCKQGFSHLDMGRSLIGSGNEKYKLKWKPTVYPLHYWYYLKEGESIPNINQGNPKYRIPREIWKRLPLFVQKNLGPYMISGIL